MSYLENSRTASGDIDEGGKFQIDLFRKAFEYTITPLVILDREFNFVCVNEAYAKACNRGISEFPGHNHFEFYPSDAKVIFDRVVETKEPYQTKARPFVFPGRPELTTYWDWTLTPILDDNGEVEYLIFSLNDVTEGKRAEEALRDNEALLQTIMKILPIGLWILDAEGEIIFSNDAAQRIWAGVRYVGLEQLGEYKGWRLDSGKPVGPHEWAGARAVEKGETTIDDEIEIECFDGTHKIILDSAVPIRGSDGSISCVVTINVDISERKRAENELRSSEEKYRSLIQKIRAAVVVHGPDTRILTSNRVAQEILGLTEDQMLGKAAIDPAWHFLREDMSVMPLEEYPVNLVIASGKPLRDYIVGVYRPDTKDRIWVLVNADPLLDEKGDLREIVVTFLDITERKPAEEAIRVSEAKFRSLFESLMIGVVIQDEGGKIIQANPAACTTLGLSMDQMMGRTAYDERWRLIKEDGTSYNPGEMPSERALRTGQGVSNFLTGIFVPEKEEYRWILINSVPVKDEKGRPIETITTFLDITDRKRAEQEKEQLLAEVNRNAAEMEAILASQDDAILMYDTAMNVQRVNPSFLNNYGFDPVGLNLRDIIQRVSCRYPDGRPLMIDEQPTPRALRGKKIDRVLFSVTKGDGTAAIVETSSKPLYVGGKVMGSVTVWHDVTKRKRAEEELRKAHDELEMRVRERTMELETTNKELSAFVYTASHVLRAPLRGINGFAHMLLDEFTDSLNEEGKRLLNSVARNAVEMAQFIDDLLSYSNMGRKEIKPSQIDMEEVARSAVRDLEIQYSKRDVRFEIAKLPTAFGDSSLIRHVFVNLISNSIKFTRPREVAIIEVGGWTEENPPLPPFPKGGISMTPGDEEGFKKGFNVYYVKDNGVGFDMKYKDKLFGVFQRLHGVDEFEGTGIGLAIVRRIMEKHGGRVWAEGKVGEGATFYFTLTKRGVFK